MVIGFGRSVVFVLVCCRVLAIRLGWSGVIGCVTYVWHFC